MDKLKEVFDAQIDIAVAAAERWKEHADDRQQKQKDLRDKGIGAVESGERIASYMKRAQGNRLDKAVNPSRLSLDFLAERVIGPDDRRKRPETAEEVKAGLPVARICNIAGPGGRPQGFGTGFMISADLLMTNNHVVDSKRACDGVGANFGHDYPDGGGAPLAGEVFELDADTFFVTDKALDFAIVKVKQTAISGAALSVQEFHPLIQQTGKILIGKPVNIIQHPQGGAKQYATAGNKLLDLLDLHLHYETDTEPGSSGSPVFSEFWETVALHHSGVPMMSNGRILDIRGNIWDRMNPDDIQWVANEGVRISKILAHLKALPLADAAQVALRDAVLAVGIVADAAPAEKTAPSVAQAVVHTKGAASPMAVSDGGAQSVIHVHGNAEIYTGNVTQNVSHGGAAPAAAERASDVSLLEKAMVFDPHYGRRRGYSPHFLRGHFIDMPSVADDRQAELVQDRFGNPQVLDYHHYSLVMNKPWMMMMWSAVNVDFSPEVRWDISRKEFGSEKWMNDPRISEALQIDNKELYAPAKKFDRGHVIRRVDSAWGVTEEEVAYANSDTFHWTNCTPQHEAFNRSNRSGIWGKLENHIADQAGAVDNRLILFAGPVLDKDRSIPHDFGGGLFRVPLEFWKVVLVAEPKSRGNSTDLHAFGFLMEQDTVIKEKGFESLSLEERFDVGEFKPQQVSLRALQERTGIVFPDAVLKADVMAKAAKDSSVPLESLDKIKLG